MFSHGKTEAEHVDEHCPTLNGEVEHILPDNTRIDCLTEYSAIEYDFTYKWYECVGQAMYYRVMTDKQAVCILIRKNGTDIELEHIERALKTVKYYHVPVHILVKE